MKKIPYFIGFLCIIFSLFSYQFTSASVKKWVRVGKYHDRVVDSIGQVAIGWRAVGWYYYADFQYVIYTKTAFRVGTKDWTDEFGNNWGVKLTGCGMYGYDEERVTMPLPDEDEVTIYKYMRYQPPSITVDDFVLNEPFPMSVSDQLNPDYIPGTADMMVESTIRTDMGLDINQKVFAWSQTNHDDYMLYDFTLTNTGNVDLDDEIELPNQTLKELYFSRMANYRDYGWLHATGQYPEDSLRMQYIYPARTENMSYDNCGRVHSSTGYLRSPEYLGEAYIHVDKSATDHSDWEIQPFVTCIDEFNAEWSMQDAGSQGDDTRLISYRIMQEGNSFRTGIPLLENTYPGTYHGQNTDEIGIKFLYEYPAFKPRVHHTSCGPYTLQPGEHIRIVLIQVAGSITPEKGWEVGTAWKAGTATPPEGMVYGVTDNLGPQYTLYPDLYSDANDWAKDCWINTGKDSIFQNAWAAQWNVRNDYDVPIPPVPPSIAIYGRPDKIEINWGDESESASDFAGYRIYRTTGNPGPRLIENQLMGSWNLIFECGEGTANALTHSYDDTTPQRGVGYYYYVAAFDDGVGNKVGVKGKKESLESAPYLSRTTKPAYLTREAGTLSTVAVVPNPFNITAYDIQFAGEKDKIMFLDIPGYCTIKIYSESGDLVKTLEHTSGSGDEAWSNVTGESFSTTDSEQIIVSGIYIAHVIENNEDGTPTGNSTNVKFLVIR